MFRAAIIGSTNRGDYGHDLHRAFEGVADVEVVALADDDDGGRERRAAEIGVSRTYRDYREMLDQAKPDVVAIGPRWVDQRRDMLLAAAQRGIHVYCEKPFCRTLAEADEIIAECERTHTRLAVAHWTRSSPRLARVKKLIAAGKFGKVLEFRGRGKEDRRGGGEDLWVLGPHIMDMIRTLGGHPRWCFATVEENGHPVTAADVKDGPEGLGPLAGDAVQATFALPDGSRACFASVRGTAANPTRFALQIFCSHGIVEILEGVLPEVHCLRDRSWSPPRSGKAWQAISSAGIGKPEPLSDAKYTRRHQLGVEDLLAAITEQREPTSGMYEARGVIEMIAAVFESHRQGGPVSLPLENRQNPLTLL